ncbi:DUF881 domain-containing protein [Mycobacterium sp. MYCO198283]|uniref:DUF881 domain-containing protein n=1 Tax=Mycobacterium sp. MYCO198283 TaxID=2883505 RepID=UPI001E531A4A|nr:DUF881 domain-containing protein [Mycobacterium sp. MYCO198283]MCG5433072.1 DUF881 domain-containing protein [Mycobacterium sp. MYCO198283]
MTAGPRAAWRTAVPVVCLLAGMLLAATHGVADGNEIRRSDAPRLVDLVREARDANDRLAAQREALTAEVEAARQATAEDERLAPLKSRIDALVLDAGLTPVRGPGLVVTLNDAQRDAEGRFPRDASPDDLVVHQQDLEAVLNALWSGGAEAVQIQDQRVVASTVARCVGNTLLLNGRTYSPPYTVTAIGDVAGMQAALAAAPLVTLYKQYVVRFGLGYTEETRTDVQLPGYTEPVAVRHAAPLTAPAGR